MTDTSNKSATPRSLNHEHPSYVSFYNRAGYPVDLGWLDYQGGLVRFRRGLANGGVSHLDTFVTHPWCAWHVNTLERASVGGREFFLPAPWRGEPHRTVVYIDRPIKSLVEMSLQAVRNLVRAEDVNQLELPKDLLEALQARRRLDFVDYITTRRR